MAQERIAKELLHLVVARKQSGQGITFKCMHPVTYFLY
jgi:hypothetical protein